MSDIQAKTGDGAGVSMCDVVIAASVPGPSCREASPFGATCRPDNTSVLPHGDRFTLGAPKKSPAGEGGAR